jgi:hypothetical protein
MDMKRILQAMDGVATKPVVGTDSMAKFLSIVDKNANVQILQEGKDPHKVSLPVQMAMQHYQAPKEESKKPVGRELTISKYFHKVEEEIAEQQAHKRQLINQYASTIAERVLMKESASKQAAVAIAKKASGKYNKDGKRIKENEIPGHSMGFKPTAGPGMGDYVVDEMTVEFDKNNPLQSKLNHKSNPGTIEYRIMRARGQIKDLAARVDSNELIVWESITRQFPELASNIEEIRHGIEELVKIRKMGGRRTGNIPKDIGEEISIKEANAIKRTLKNSNPCWTGYHPVGTKKKGGRAVPNCVPKEK